MLDEIVFQNPWWKSGQMEKSRVGKLKRIIFEDIKNDIHSKKITCLLGPRRAGKTTLLYKVINYLLDKGVQKQNIFYTSLDNSRIRLHLEQNFDELLKEYVITQVREPIDGLSETVYVFLDEVHKLPDWGNKVKYWQDLGFQLKFIVTGSSSLRILRGSGESLQGRINFHIVLPLLFSEFSEKIVSADILKFKDLKSINIDLLPDKQKYKVKLEEYLLRGGYPEIFFEKDLESAYQELRKYKTLTITREILDLKDIKEPRVLSDLFDLLSDSMSERMNYSQFAKLLKIKVDTVKSYITYLEECFLVYTAYQYSPRQVLSTRKEKKLFFMDHGLRNALFMKDITDMEKSKIVENAVFIHLFARKKNELYPKMFFWLDEKKREVDCVVTLGRDVVGVEVKYQNQISASDETNLRKFMGRYNCKKGIIVTKDLLEKRGDIILIPAWLFLLTV